MKYTEKLFSYGTLKLEEVQQGIFGRTLTGEADALLGYQLSTLKIENAEAVTISGLTEHPMAVYTGDDNDEVSGIVYHVSQEEFMHADNYEAPGYKRIKVKLKSENDAWLYVPVT